MDADVGLRVGVIVAVLAVLWVLSDWDRYRRRTVRLGRALHLNAPAPTQPVGPPIERIAADIQRLRTQIEQAPPGMPVARMRGWLQAYDDVLVIACQALGLEEHLRTVPEGAERNLERERVERMLARAGLELGSPD